MEMFDARLPARLWVDGLVRRAQVAGASAFIVNSGDAARGDVLVKVATLDGGARAYVPGMSMAGARVFVDLELRGIPPIEAEIDAYVARAIARDRDIWVIEIEDRAGRHFLTEPVEGPLSGGDVT